MYGGWGKCPHLFPPDGESARLGECRGIRVRDRLPFTFPIL
jgi:hypothetical protein